MDRDVHGARCRKVMAAELLAHWRWNEELFTIEAGDRVEIQFPDRTILAEMVQAEVKRLPMPVDGLTEYSTFLWKERS